ncbi:hypothetical protein J2W57_000836 [Chryseobacterium ginsenosidimutans]|uniref:Uncharacterized protein n=1 Tax=Chryseobacterium geocarposphaerae TaxID=1416776 RepID=A0ABU1LF26_9FLAO|nr:hypothetical protein [Chryseobacterium geocarposphaerae]MDR6697476.1 hypothetical protein [Chryseobacterium ginsenosidimutans]
MYKICHLLWNNYPIVESIKVLKIQVTSFTDLQKTLKGDKIHINITNKSFYSEVKSIFSQKIFNQFKTL